VGSLNHGFGEEDQQRSQRANINHHIGNLLPAGAVRYGTAQRFVETRPFRTRGPPFPALHPGKISPREDLTPGTSRVSPVRRPLSISAGVAALLASAFSPRLSVPQGCRSRPGSYINLVTSREQHSCPLPTLSTCYLNERDKEHVNMSKPLPRIC